MYIAQSTRFLLLVTSLCLLSTLQTSGQHSEDGCHWLLWDTTDDDRGVRSVYPSCDEGSVQWKNIQGALRLVFTKRLPITQSTFGLCIIAHTAHTTVQISRVSPNELRRVVLLTPEAPETDGDICVTSQNGDKQIVLFVEHIKDSGPTSVGLIDIEYELINTALSFEGSSNHSEACRPCTDYELERFACLADFVVRGNIHHIQEKPHRKETEIHLSVNKMYRQLHPVFKPVTVTKSSYLHRTNSLNERTVYKHEKHSIVTSHTGHVILPDRCHSRKGAGEFVFIGKIRLKRAHLLCAPRADYFERLWTHARNKGENLCTLL